MFLRRAIFFAQFPLAVLLPVWVLITRGIIADGIGLTFLVYLVACPVLFVVLAVISGLVAARKTVRTQRAVSWIDAALLGAIWLSLVAYGLFAFPVLAVVVVLLVIGGFWLVFVEWVNETRHRVKDLFDMTPRNDPNVIVVPPEGISK